MLSKPPQNLLHSPIAALEAPYGRRTGHGLMLMHALLSIKFKLSTTKRAPAAHLVLAPYMYDKKLEAVVNGERLPRLARPKSKSINYRIDSVLQPAITYRRALFIVEPKWTY